MVCRARGLGQCARPARERAQRRRLGQVGGSKVAWRGAHAFAATSGRYLPLARWTLAAIDGTPTLCGEIELPLATGIVGGTFALPYALLSLELLGATTTQQVAQTLAAVGLASNLAALRALADEGIQQGHMRLHRRRQ